MIPIWLEVHVDDVRLSREPATWPEVAALLDRLATLAQAEGAQISFRVREKFASMDQAGFLQGLERRGHEVGWHAHGRRLGQAAAALRRAGVHTSIAAPGLVQAQGDGRLAVLEQTRALGVARITDRCEGHRAFAYQGWLAWEPLPGLKSMDVSVAPWEWKLDFQELARRVDVQSRWRVPDSSSGFFGATFHEHDVDARLEEGLARFLGRYRSRVVASGSIPLHTAPMVETPRTLNLPRRMRTAIVARTRNATGEVRVGARRVAFRRLGPTSPRAALLVVHGGKSGIRQGLDPIGLPEDAFLEHGIALWTFARTEGTFRTPGNPVHHADTRAVFARAREEATTVAVLSWSGGVVSALHLDTPLLIDAEGPCDRFSLVERGGNEMSGLDLHDDAAWEGREAVELVGTFRGRYRRLQGTQDHVHGPMTLHASRMLEAAGNGSWLCGGPLPGRVESHGARVRAGLLAEIERLVRA